MKANRMDSYNPHELPERWLLGACSSGDPLRWAVVAVHEKLTRLREIERAAQEIDKAIGQWAGVALSPEVSRAYGALSDTLDGISR